MIGSAFTLIGEKLSHSWSPSIHEAFFRLQNISASYTLTEIKKDELGDACERLRHDYAGANVTIPYKVDIISFLDSLTHDAQAVGAVNTIENKGGRLIGHNTDVGGFKSMLQYHGFTVQGRPCAVLGAGGASLASKKALLDMGAKEVCVFSRNPSTKPGTRSYDELAHYQGGLLVNCTPAGMYPGPMKSPISDDLLNHFDEVADMIYNPTETLLVKNMKAMQKKAATGLYMLVYQAALAQEIWLSKPICAPWVEEVYQLIKKEMQP